MKVMWKTSTFHTVSPQTGCVLATKEDEDGLFFLNPRNASNVLWTVAEDGMDVPYTTPPPSESW